MPAHTRERFASVAAADLPVPPPWREQAGSWALAGPCPCRVLAYAPGRSFTGSDTVEIEVRNAITGWVVERKSGVTWETLGINGAAFDLAQVHLMPLRA